MTTPASANISDRELVQSIDFGSRVAEDESENLASYFVKTETWRKVREGKVDVVLAPKGGGKSAIYSMLVSNEDALFDDRVLLAPGENITGQPVFSSISPNDHDEDDFARIWKLYFLALIAEELDSYEIRTPDSTKLFEYLRDAGLLPNHRPKTTILELVKHYVKQFFSYKSAETTLHLSETGMASGISQKIEFSEPSPENTQRGHVSIDNLYRLAENALEQNNYALWIILDRLDVAFASSPELETNALRALFRAYSDIGAYKRISLKIFLRTDIWQSITQGGFREASHIVRDTIITWSPDSLRQLLVRRLTQSEKLCKHYSVDADKVVEDANNQEDFFYQVFPRQIDGGSGKSQTFNWCLRRTEDGKGVTAPRELIHLFSETRDAQLRRYETGQTPPTPPAIFHPKSFEDALPAVSEARLQRTIYAEFSDVRDKIEDLRSEKSEQNMASLSRIWNTDLVETESIVARLVDIGFLTERGSGYWIPFMYRPALDLTQGAADEVKASKG